MMTSLYSAVSGLRNHQLQMDVIGDNIANVNTIGFKESRVSFATALCQLLRGAQGPSGIYGGMNPIEVGLGSRVSSIDRIFNQGNFENTGSPTDMAVQGDGFFVVGSGSEQFFTRGGNFQIDADGSLLAQGGRYSVLGRLADTNGNLISSSSVEPLVLPFGEKDPAKATTEIKYFCNLDSQASKEQTWTASLAFTTDTNPASGTTALNDLDQVTAALDDGDTIVISGTDQQGNAVSVTFTYGATNDGTTVQDLIDIINSAGGYDSADPAGSTISIDASGKMILRDNQRGVSLSTIRMNFADTGTSPSAMLLPTFINTQTGATGTHSASIYVYDSRGERHRVEITFTQDVTTENSWDWEIIVDDGRLNATNAGLSGNQGTVTFNTDGTLNTFTGGPLTFTPPGAQGVVINLNGGTVGTNDGITQYASSSTTIALNQDGYGMGDLQDFSITETGEIIGSYSNGVSRTLGQLALARFANAPGLELAGENLYRATVNSGDPKIRVESGVVNRIYSGYLELSTVDLAREFTNMIVAQRGFQANARVITTADQLLQEVTQIKR
jgi:flagellar hook protein FlgE